ncbi:MAG: RNA 2',3'-cyclic phosphodiesterase [Candidatus Altiarchaeota archaeon]|nr:RNA 2',3'-cyclic phosphodiesterase [Candidatus Altiarchaeota archaeon]
MRAFIAIRCPGEIAGRLAVFQKGIGALGSFKMVPPENIHLTLKFLGEIDEQLAGSICTVLEGVKAGPFQVSVKGVSAFPDLRRPGVVWAGVDSGCVGITRLHETVDSALEGLDFERDSRFACHFTLARVKHLADREGFGKAVEKCMDKEYGSFCVEGMDLMKSELGRTGPVYSPYKSFPFV